MRRFSAILLFLAFAVSSSGQRYSRTINENWRFTGGMSGMTETVSIPLSPTHFATSGVYIDTFDEEASQSGVRIRTFLSIDMPFARRVTLIHDIYGPAGQKVACVSQKATDSRTWCQTPSDSDIFVSILTKA